MAGQARIDLHTAGRLQLKSTYDKDFVEALKRTIPPGGREWDSSIKAWLIDDLYHQALLDVLAQHQYTVRSTCAAPGPATPEPQVPAAYAPLPAVMPGELLRAFATLHLWWNTPLEVCEASYKAWARLVHPDIGGNLAQMQAMTDAIMTIRRHLKGTP